MCNGVYVENEFHILFRCSKYNVERAKYLPISLIVYPSIYKLHNIIMCLNINMINDIIKLLRRDTTPLRVIEKNISKQLKICKYQ